MPLLAHDEDNHHEWAQILRAEPSKTEIDLDGVVSAVMYTIHPHRTWDRIRWRS